MANRVTATSPVEVGQSSRQATVDGSPQPRFVLGIDPGLNRTGYGVIEVRHHKVVDAGFVQSTETASLPRRLREIDAGISAVLSEHAVGLVAVEDLFAHYAHPRTAILMGHVRGVILLAAAKLGVEIVSLPATRVKKTLTGNGHASKVQVQRAIAATLGLQALPEPADVADALAIALCGVLDRSGSLAAASAARIQ